MRVFLILKKIWFDQIEDRTKGSEYRDNTPFWRKRLLEKKVTQVMFQLGYSSERRMIAEVLEVKEIERNGKPTIELVLGTIFDEKTYNDSISELEKAII